MIVVNKSIAEITPYVKNPRKNDKAVEPVMNSIREFGFKVPIVVDKGGTIVAGHTRYRAAIELGMKEVPCIVADDLTDEQIRAFRLADNKVAELAEWDFPMLDDELITIEGIDMSDFGFTDYNIDWADVEELDEETYEPPEVKKLKCPCCGHIDDVKNFEKLVVEKTAEETVEVE